MAVMTGVEYTLTAVGRPALAVMVGNKLCSFQDIPGGPHQWSVLDTTTLAAAAYTAWDYVQSAVAHSGYAFMTASGGGQSGILRRYDPATGAFLSITDPYNNTAKQVYPPLVVHGDWIVGANRRYKPSTATFADWTRGSTSMGAAAGRFFAASATTLNEVDPITDTLINTWTLPESVLPGPNGARGTYLDGVIWWPAAGSSTSLFAVGLDLASNTPKGIVLSPGTVTPGYSGVTPEFTAGPDGYLYRMVDTNTMLVVNPATGQWATPSLPTIRANRFTVVNHAGDLWVPSGTP